jgi:hypothetical protein
MGIRFSGYHEDTGLLAVEILRLQHYRLLTGAMVDKLPELWTFMKSVETNLCSRDVTKILS